MFSTIKAKLIVVIVSTFSVFSIILIFFIFINFKYNQSLLIRSVDFTITGFAEQINKDIKELENNVAELALLGEIYYDNVRTKEFSNKMVKTVFEKYKTAIGGGIWFEPYLVNPAKRFNCTYAFRDNGNIVLDEGFSSEFYNYLNQSWYREIKSNLSQKNKIVWSVPYYDEQGSFSLMTTLGAGIYYKGKFIGMSTVDWEVASIIDTVSTMEPTPGSFVLFADKHHDYVIATTDPFIEETKISGKSLKSIEWYNPDIDNIQHFSYHGKDYISYVKNLDNGMVFVVNVPSEELHAHLIKQVLLLTILLFGTTLFVGILIYFILNKNINKPLEKLSYAAEKLGQGYLDEKIHIKEPKEFANLANSFNKMTHDIKNYIKNLNKMTQDKEKIESELSIARNIQYSVLPDKFYEEKEEFDIFAYMKTAKEVGGDFYDFYFINPHQFMFLIADVSGKGVPAALFMMTTKTLIKNTVKEGLPPRETIEKINNQICENNKEGFFVTMFAGLADIETGKMYYINCGHNPPLIKRNNSHWEYLKIKPNLVLGALDNISYDIVETNFEENDVIFLYTDGITEAMNKDNELWGEERLLNCLNNTSTIIPQNLIENVKNNVFKYIGDVEQSDDMTMLTFKYNGIKNQIITQDFDVPAKMEHFEFIRNKIENINKQNNVSDEIISKISIIFEEIYLNIVNYAYKDNSGTIKILFKKSDDTIELIFMDFGIKYNPLEKPDPDVTLGAEDRDIGGLGVFMVKKLANKINYEYKDNMNILKIEIKFKEKKSC